MAHKSKELEEDVKNVFRESGKALDCEDVSKKLKMRWNIVAIQKIMDKLKKKGLIKEVDLMSDKIQSKRGLGVLLRHGKLIEPSRIFCDRIEYVHTRGTFNGKPTFNHHIMFWLGDKLVFKVWLPNKQNSKEYKGVMEALEGVKFKIT